jgi:cytochrome b561
MQDAQTLNSYDSTTRWLHWGSALFIVMLFGLGLGIDWVPRGEPKIMVRSVHIALGALLALLLVYRVLW